MILSLALLPLLMARAAGGESAGTELELKAEAAKTKAERELAEWRAAQADERKALAARLQQAYAELNAAKDLSDKNETEMRQLAKSVEEFRRDEASFRYKARVLRGQLELAAGQALNLQQDAAGVTSEIWRSLEKRLAELDAAGEAAVTQETVTTRTGERKPLPVLRLGAAAYACGDDNETCGLLAATPDGGRRIAGLAPDTQGARALASAATGDLSIVPVDVTGSLADRAAEQAQTWAGWLRAGGIFVYPIILSGILGVMLVIERLSYLLRSSPAGTELARLRGLLRAGEANAGEFGETPEGRVALAARRGAAEAESRRESRLESALLAEAPGLNRSLSLLAALAGVAPLLGLLGTVSGMIHTFADIASFGTGNSRLLSGGISEALITTQLGLMVAVPLLLCHAWLARSIERREVLLEQWGMETLRLAAEGQA